MYDQLTTKTVVIMADEINEQSPQQGKKIIRIKAPTWEKGIPVKYTKEMDALSIKELLNLIGDQYQQSNDITKAMAIRSLAQRTIMHNGRTQNVNTKLKDLNYDMRTTTAGEALIADLNFETSHVGGQ